MLNSESSLRGDDSSATPQRELVLQEGAERAARDWTRQWFRTLADDGRPIEGGWPGTVQEARACVAVGAGRLLLERAMPALTRDELGRLTRTTYDEARRLWRTNVAPAG